MAEKGGGRGGGAGRGGYVNGKYVPAGGGGRGGGKKEWTGPSDFERKVGDEDISLERKFDVDIIQPGETRIGYLFNMKISRHYDENGRTLAGMLLYFLQRDGRTFRATFLYRPYFFVQLRNPQIIDRMRDILAQRWEADGVHAEVLQRVDLTMEDHVVGRTRPVIKLSFDSEEGLKRARRDITMEQKRGRKKESFSFGGQSNNDSAGAADAMQEIEDVFEHDVLFTNRVCIDKGINAGRWFEVARNPMATSVDDIWDNQCTVVAQEKMLFKPGLRIFAWDIECTKEPLKFPDSAHDRITMISVMVDGAGFLIVNRAEVSADIEPLEYTPKPQYEGIFDTYNEVDEAALLRRFFQLIMDTSPHIMVSFNGDFFDFPFVENRCKAYNINMKEEVGLGKLEGEDFYAGLWMVHLDCFAWVQRDSMLPCGARGLKAVTRYKLKYDPVELDPEDMTPFAKERPQDLAAYSVSDAVATYYLYMKYIHDFIFALCSIIPYGPDDVLRKGSGTLCESLLMAEAFKVEVLFPNKHKDPLLEYHEETNRLIETSSYEGARVECMRVGVYRADIPETFQLEPSAFQTLLNQVRPTCDFFLTIEENTKLEDVANLVEIYEQIENELRALCDPDKVQAQLGREAAASPGSKRDDDYNLQLVEYEVVEGKGGVKSGGKKIKKATHRVIMDDLPLIYHLDVGAMYPNIILSNRLQPSAIVSDEFCAACSYNDPANKCRRPMDWKWHGEIYMATRADVKSIVNEMESNKNKFNQKDRDTGEMKRVNWNELFEKEKGAEITKAVRVFSQKAYRRMKTAVYEDKTDVVCQRENPFYVDCVRNFRDRRYIFKGLVKKWTKALEAAEEKGDFAAMTEATDMAALNDSLQLAHKCILNSFYGYVMRKGARWHSLQMAGITTYTGSNLIREAREFVEMVGLPIELDTDGIWCMLPKKFPDTFKFMLKDGKNIKFAYSNSVLNWRVHDKYTNHQYQDLNKETGEWVMKSENSIFFEIDGPYKAMVLPASTEEDKMLKKRYAVYNFDGSLAELKGFEIKRRGELKMIQVFQEEVFPVFLHGKTKQDVWNCVGALANQWLDVLESKGSTMTDDEVLYFISENKTLSKSVEASGTYKSVQITTARRLAEFLQVDSFIKDGGINCQLLIATKPLNKSTTERAIPVKVFNADYEVKKVWLRKWLEDDSLNDFDMRSIIDWDYYKERLCAVFQKLISIPAAYQKYTNPCPRVGIPLWLHKRVAEQNDKCKQQSLGLWLRKTGPEATGLGADAKRKLGDMEDLGSAAAMLGERAREAAKKLEAMPLVEFGKGPKRWLQVQKARWAVGGAAAQVRGRSSLFDDSAAWMQVATEALRSDWHIVAVEPAQSVRGQTNLRVGDTVLADVGDVDFDEGDGETQRGTLVGFLGGMVRVSFPHGGERLLSREKVQAVEEEGLFVLWVATGSSLNLHRCEVLIKRRVTLGLESVFDPDEARGAVRQEDLVKGMRVWPVDEDEKRIGPGIVTEFAREIGLCNVTWQTGFSEAVFAQDLERQCGVASMVVRDPPRNLHHGCLIELELEEAEFQKQRGEGAVGDADGTWPRVDAVYEAEQPLEFDLLCRLGPMVRVNEPDRIEEKRLSTLRLGLKDLSVANPSQYLHAAVPERNIYLYLCFDRARPSQAFCGLFAPALSEACVCFSGINATDGESLRPSLEQLLSDQLATISSAGAPVRAEVSFASGRSVGALLQWVEQRLLDVRRRDGNSICVLCAQLSTAELRGAAPSSFIEQRHLRHLTALREMPVCRAPFSQQDAQFPALNWPTWITKRFAGKVPQLFGWWSGRLALCRAAGLPICNVPEMPAAMVPKALDALYSRQLQKDGQLRWASSAMRPDLGETAAALLDRQEECVESVHRLLKGRETETGSGQGGAQINIPGTSRSVCLEVNLRARLCICALQHAKYLSDMEGGELSKKFIHKVKTGGDEMMRNLEHTSEVSLTGFESLISVVLSIVEARDNKVKEIAIIRKRWSTAANCHLDIPADDVSEFIAQMAEAGHIDKVLAARLEEVHQEHEAQVKLLDGLYSWLACPTSLLYDPALLRKVHNYMDKTLQLFCQVLKRNGCQIIHASYSKVLFATGKLRVIPDVQNFWESLCDNVRSVRALQPLQLEPSSLSELFYGILWLDPVNWVGVPIDPGTGEVQMKARSCWKIADFLPPAVRPSLNLYAGELLIGPQRELQRQLFGPAPGAAAGVDEDMAGDAACAAEADDDVECKGMDVDADGDEEEEGDCEKAVAAEPVVPAEEPGIAAPANPGPKDATVLADLDKFIKGDFWETLRRRVLHYLDEIQEQQARECPGGIAVAPLLMPRAARHGDESSGEEEDEEEREREKDDLRQHVQQKWSFPEISGRCLPAGTVHFEFMRTLIQIFQLEEVVADQVTALRDRMCQKIRVSNFSRTLTFESPRYPIVLRDVSCPWCCSASNVDVTAHLSRGPGLWVCVHCNHHYDKEGMQAALVAHLENAVQAWQSQEITCIKCKSLRTSKMQKFCHCFGKFQARFDEKDFRLLLGMVRTLVVPHDLTWLGECLDMYEQML